MTFANVMFFNILGANVCEFVCVKLL